MDIDNLSKRIEEKYEPLLHDLINEIINSKESEGKNAKDNIGRIKEELEFIHKYNQSIQFYHTYYLCKYLRDNNIPFWCSSTIGSSYIAYVSGMTEFNPIKEDPYTVFGSPAYYEIRVPNSLLDNVWAFITEYRIKNELEIIDSYNFTSGQIYKVYLIDNYFVEPDVHKRKIGCMFSILSSYDLDILYEFKEKDYTLEKGVEAVKELEILGHSPFEIIIQFDKNHSALNFPNSSNDDFCKIIYCNCIEDAKSKFGVRETIYYTLISNGCPKELAYEIMSKVRKGHAIDVDWNAYLKYIDNSFIEECNQVKYLSPYAHVREVTSIKLKLAYYKFNYPLEYCSFIENKLYSILGDK